VLTVILVAVFCGIAAAQQHITGSLPDGATYVIDVPVSWNGTAVRTLGLRLATGKWHDLAVATWTLRPPLWDLSLMWSTSTVTWWKTPLAILKFEPRQFLRIFDAFSQ
jgi:hypothetical protein